MSFTHSLVTASPSGVLGAVLDAIFPELHQRLLSVFISFSNSLGKFLLRESPLEAVITPWSFGWTQVVAFGGETPLGYWDKAH